MYLVMDVLHFVLLSPIIMCGWVNKLSFITILQVNIFHLYYSSWNLSYFGIGSPFHKALLHISLLNYHFASHLNCRTFSFG